MMQIPSHPHAADESADVLVVGGGLCGALVAEQLAAHGLSTLVLEAGPVLERRLPSCDLGHYRESVEPLLGIDEPTWQYAVEGPALEWIRVRAGGGRSLIWGGWALRPHPQSFRDARAFGRPWPLSVDDLEQHLWRVERLLGVTEGEEDPRFRRVGERLGLEIRPKRAALGPCGCRPYVALDRLARARLRSRAIVTRILFDPRRRAIGAEFVDATTGIRRVARARCTVLAASTVETTRLLLVSLPDGASTTRALVGPGFHDHQVLSYLVLVPEPAPHSGLAKPLERVAFVPRFVNLGRQRRRDYRGGFTLEIRGPESLTTLEPELRVALGLATAPAGEHSFHLVHAIGETPPRQESTVTLHPVARDALGRPVPVLRLVAGTEDAIMAQDMEDTALAVCDALAVPGSRIIPLRPGGTARPTTHEAGTCPMGRHPDRSVTDLTGRVRGVTGLYLADASVLPTALDRAPTLTLLALALSTADGIRESARSGSR